MLKLKKIYVASDGKEFENFKDADAYDNSLTRTITVTYYYNANVTRNIEVPNNATQEEIDEILLKEEQENYPEDMEVNFEEYIIED